MNEYNQSHIASKLWSWDLNLDTSFSKLQDRIPFINSALSASQFWRQCGHILDNFASLVAFYWDTALLPRYSARVCWDDWVSMTTPEKEEGLWSPIRFSFLSIEAAITDWESFLLSLTPAQCVICSLGRRHVPGPSWLTSHEVQLSAAWPTFMGRGSRFHSQSMSKSPSFLEDSGPAHRETCLGPGTMARILLHHWESWAFQWAAILLHREWI